MSAVWFIVRPVYTSTAVHQGLVELFDGTVTIAAALTISTKVYPVWAIES